MQEKNKLFRQYRRVIFAILALFIADVAIWYLILFASSSSENLELYFLDVGQGDSQLINLPTGVQVLIDGGQPNGKVLSELSEILSPSDNYIDMVLMTHPQLDHFGGLIDVLKKYEVGAFIGTGRKGEINAYQELVVTIKEKNIPYVALKEGDTIRNGESVFRVLSPNSQNFLSGELNDTSLVLMFENSGLRALYTGDIGFSVEHELAQKYNLRAQILKVPHHGSKFSSGLEFLEAVNPQVAVVGVGKNSYGHPTDVVLERLVGVGAKIFRTDKDETIKIYFGAGNMRIYNNRQAD